MQATWLRALSCSLVVSVLNITISTTSAGAVSLVNTITIPGNSTDLFPTQGAGGANVNRLGGFFSDLYYDRSQNVYYGIPDRGPGGGLIDYQTRVQKFSLNVDSNTGAISNFNLLQTIPLTNNNQPYNGLNPSLLTGNAGNLGQSLDPEGFAVAPNGNFYVSDEYGPSVYEFTPTGSFVRAFTTPNNLIPRDSNGNTNYVAGRDTITSGRQDNRGFEGLTLSPDGSKLFAILQDPLVNEGSNNDGRRSQNMRIVEFNTATGQSSAQYIYQLESLTAINDRIPGTTNDFSATAQGRNIGVSGIIALNNNEFLVLERDNRGIGEADPTGTAPVASKQVYRIDLRGATNVSGISLAGTNTLPAGVTPVAKAPFLDIAGVLQNAGQLIPEKLEGLAIGPQLADGSFPLLIGTDNDFSVTQTGAGVQFDVCSGGTQVAIDAGCPSGETLLPTYLYSFRATNAELTTPIPEPPATAGLVLLGLGYFGLKRQQHKAKKLKGG